MHLAPGVAAPPLLAARPPNYERPSPAPATHNGTGVLSGLRASGFRAPPPTNDQPQPPRALAQPEARGGRGGRALNNAPTERAVPLQVPGLRAAVEPFLLVQLF
jgi:hypothetical protein